MRRLYRLVDKLTMPYDALLKPYQGEDESEHHADIEYEAVSPGMVGKKWLVVVDYHF
jgi:hypothetical protein